MGVGCGGVSVGRGCGGVGVGRGCGEVHMRERCSVNIAKFQKQTEKLKQKEHAYWEEI